jgi:hypothetical protein
VFAILQMLLNQIRPVVSEDDDIGEAVLFRQLNLVLKERFATNGNHWLRQIAEPRLKTHAHSAS